MQALTMPSRTDTAEGIFIGKKDFINPLPRSLISAISNSVTPHSPQ